MKKTDDSVKFLVVAGLILTVTVLLAGYFDSPEFYDVVPQLKNETVVSELNLKAENNRIDINSADEDELSKLYGIGKSRAKAIIEYRENNGGFFTVEELANISGISEKIIEKNKELITVGEYTEVNYETESDRKSK